MEVTVNGEKIALGKREKKVGNEAPAVRVKMQNGETKVIGMMADKVQCFVTIEKAESLSDALLEVINKHKEKALIYLISSGELNGKTDEDMSSSEFKDFSLKFGVNISDELCAKSIFIVNKDGEIEYKEVLEDLGSEFNISEFDEKLDAAIKFKKKGHTHENWMGV